jgi:RNA polymerase sigma-70 factor, ECF subfamily
METMKALAITAMSIPADPPRPAGTVLAAACAGDLAAFDTLMRQYERLVLVTALRLTGSLPDAQDISQEVFLKLYRNLRKVEDSGLASWLYRVTVNACHDQRRRRRPESPVEFAALVPSTDLDPQQTLTQAERRRVLELSLRMLPDKERAAFVLRDLEGLPTEEVARILGSSEVTVRSQISKARVKIKDFVERYFRRRT